MLPKNTPTLTQAVAGKPAKKPADKFKKTQKPRIRPGLHFSNI